MTRNSKVRQQEDPPKKEAPDADPKEGEDPPVADAKEDEEKKTDDDAAAVKALLGAILSELSGTLNKVIAKLGLGALLGFINPLGTALSNLIDALKELVDQLLELVKQLLDGILEGLSDALRGVKFD